MNRSLTVFTAVLALSQTGPSPVTAQEAWSQLIANAGLTPAEAQGISLQELAILNYNRGSRSDDDIVLVMSRGPVALDPVAHVQLIASSRSPRADSAPLTLTEVFAYKIDRDNADDLHRISSPAPVQVDVVEHTQLIAAAGFTPQEAADLTLMDLGVAKSTLDGGAR